VRLLFPRGRSRAPLAIAAFISIPLFFSSLMATTLALEKPHTIAWKGGKHGLLITWHDPTAANVASIWLWALVPPLVLCMVGLVAVRLPFGFYVPCAAAIVLAIAVVHDIDKWTRHHTARFPVGVDLIPASNAASNKFDRGQWELMARDTAVSLSHWTIALALASALVLAFLTVRRRYFARGPVLEEPPLEGVHATDATTPGLGGPWPDG
jgi:hypothetical protein